MEKPRDLKVENSPEFKNYNQGDIIEDVSFEHAQAKKRDIFKSSADNRKILQLDSGSMIPVPGKKYNVIVISDSIPDDPARGKLMVQIVPDQDEDNEHSGTYSIQLEEVVDKAERFNRQRNRASTLLHEQTGMTREQRSNIKPETVITDAKQPRVVSAALAREREFDASVLHILGADKSDEQSLVALRSKNVERALRKDKAIQNRRRKLLDEEAEILSSIDAAPSLSITDALKAIRSELELVEREHEMLMQSNPEAYYALHLKDLKRFHSDLTDGRIVETPYVKEHAEDVVAHLRANQPTLLYGHLGSGKTEFAMHVAKNYLGKEALVISGSKNISLAEFYGHQVLAIDKIDKTDLDIFINEVEEKYTAWKNDNSGASAEDLDKAHDRILQAYLTQFKSGTISQYFLGPMYRAMADGRPIIIDEVNAIPHEILISLNHILTRRVGDTVNVQQDSGKEVEVKEGWGVMMTGNLNQGQDQYIERQDMDPAFLSRLYKKEYDYLPQSKEGGLEAEAGAKNELFHVMLAKMMDKNGNLNVPNGTINKIWKLAQAARLTQDVFSGREVTSAFHFKEGAGRAIPYYLQESVLSMRAIDRILSQYQKEGFKRDLDYYVWNEFVGQATNLTDRAYLYQQLQAQFGFFSSKNGWSPSPMHSGGRVLSFPIDVPENKPQGQNFFGPRDIVDYAYGKGPKRK